MTDEQKLSEGIVTFLDSDEGTGYIKLPDGTEVEFNRDSMQGVVPEDLCEGMPVLFQMVGDDDDPFAAGLHATPKSLAMARQEPPDAVAKLLDGNEEAQVFSCHFTADGAKAVLLVSHAYETFDLYIYDPTDQSLTNICGGPMGLQDIPATTAFWAKDHELIMIVNDGHPNRMYFPFEIVDGGVRQADTLDDSSELRELSKYVRPLVEVPNG